MSRLIGHLGKAHAQGREILGATLQPIQVIVSTGDASTWHGPAGGGDITEMVILANSDNVGYVNIAVDAPSGASNYFPLLPGESLGVEGLTLDQLHLLFEKNTDKIHLAYIQVGV